MSFISGRRNQLQAVAFTLVFLIVPASLGYGVYVISQRAYFTKRDFRTLESISTQANLKIENIATTLVNAEGKARSVGGGSQSYLCAVEAAVEEVDAYVSLKLDPTLLASLQCPERQHSSPMQGRTGQGRAQVVCPKRPGSQESSALPITTQLTVSATSDQGSWLVFDFVGRRDAEHPRFQARSDIKMLFGTTVDRYLFDELNPATEQLFDEIVIAELPTGKVVFESGKSAVQMLSLPGILPDSTKKGGESAGDGASRMSDIEIAGTSYKVFMQPFALPISSSRQSGGQAQDDTTVRWIACGLITSDHFRDQTFAVSYTVIILFFFLIVITLLSFPLLKLILMGRTYKATPGDLWGTAISLVAAASLITFLLVDSYLYVTLNDQLDAQLVSLAGNLEQNYKGEIGLIVKQLAGLTEKVKSLPDAELTKSERDLIASSQHIGTRATAADDIDTAWRADILEHEISWDTGYPFFNTAFWIDPTGQQRIKWTTRGAATSFLCVKDRKYFTNVRTGNMWPVGSGGARGKYTLELIKSRNTGENVAVISAPVDGSDWVASLDTSFVSLGQPVLPSGYGYALIGETGDVFFHSQPVKNLDENLFEECSYDRLLRAAVLSRTSEFVNARYMGRGHRLYVTPLPQTPFSIVVFADKQILRTVNLEIITLSFLFFGGYAVLVLAMVLVTLLCKPQQWGSWFGPDSAPPGQTATERHGAALAIHLLLIIIFIPCILGLESWRLVAITVFVPIAAFLLFTVLARKNTSTFGARLAGFIPIDKLNSRSQWALSLSLLLILISVLPTLAFFKIARDFGVCKLIKQGQMSIAVALERKQRSIRRQYARVRIGVPEREKLARVADKLGSAKTDGWGNYVEFFFGTTLSENPETLPVRPPSTLGNLLSKITPFYNQTSVDRHELYRSAASDLSWSSAGDLYSGLSLHYTPETGESRLRVKLESKTERFEKLTAAWWWALMAFYAALILAGCMAALRFIATKVGTTSPGLSPGQTPAVASDKPAESDKGGRSESYWDLAKLPISLVVVTIAVFLFVTQKDFYDSTMTFLSAGYGGLAAVVKLLGLFHQGKEPG
ncbi:MAG TPA: hypothetical protein VFV34_03270 [Blastocatellia bacterium]|nr:hypothetical protein [Blastocatellia bacterium]